ISIKSLSPYVGGKTGTSDEENDAWFVGFTNQVTVAVWVGYDNADMRQRRTLGGGRTGGNTAIPIWQPIMQAVWANYAKQEPLRGPSPEASKFLVSRGIDPQSGERLSPRAGGGFVEWFRTDASGQIAATPSHLNSRYGGYNGMGGDNPLSALFNLFDRGGPSGPYSGGPREMRPPGPVGPNGGAAPPWRRDFFDRLF